MKLLRGRREEPGNEAVACQNGSVPEWLSRSSGPGNKRRVIVAFSAPLGTVHA